MTSCSGPTAQTDCSKATRYTQFTTILIAALREEQIADPFQDPVVPDIVSANELAALEAPLMS